MTLRRVSQPDPLRTQPEAAATVASDTRAVGASVSDAHDALAAQGMPADWKGAASEAASNQFTTLARGLDAAVAALTKAATVLDAYDHALARLHSRRLTLIHEVGVVNARINAYDSDVATIQDAATQDTTAQRGLIARYAELERDATALQAEVDRWNVDQDTADADAIRGLRGVDTVAEGEQVATDARAPDVAALTSQLQAKVAADDPKAVAAWWAALSVAEREALMIHSPDVVGNAGGIPAVDRDQANRASVLSVIDELSERKSHGGLTSIEQDELSNAEDAQKTLADYDDKIDPDTGLSEAYLLVFRPSAFGGDGGVALSLGNPDTADDVTAFVPGLTSEASSLGSNMDNLERLRALATAKDGGGSVAAITWIDYDAPSNSRGLTDDPWDFLSVAGQGKATDGGQRFADFVSGLHASDTGALAHFTAIGHSYGSTTVAHAATDDHLSVDDMVLIGSPGTGSADRATDLMANGHVYVGSAAYDPVSLLGSPGIGALGTDPAQAAFGAHRFEVDPGSYRVQNLLTNHSSYFDKGSTSLDAMADVVAGQQPADVGGRVPGHYQDLSALVTGSTLASGGHEVWDGTKWVGGEIGDGAGWAWDRATDLGSWLNPLD